MHGQQFTVEDVQPNETKYKEAIARAMTYGRENDDNSVASSTAIPCMLQMQEPMVCVMKRHNDRNNHDSR